MSDATYVDPWAEQQAGYMRQKLAAAGATQDEIDEFIDQWVHDPAWDHADKQRVLALGDGKLRAELAKARVDGLRDTETEDEERSRLTDEAAAGEATARRSEAETVSGWGLHDILEWVGGDVDRARQVLAVEEAHPRPRTDLISALIRVLNP